MISILFAGGHGTMVRINSFRTPYISEWKWILHQNSILGVFESDKVALRWLLADVLCLDELDVFL
jgi:hypothetical protein